MHELLRNPDSFYKVLELTVSTLDLNDMLTNVVEEMRDLFGSDRCTLYVVDKNKNELYTKVAQKCSIDHFTLPMDKHSIAGFVAVTGNNVQIQDVYDEKKLKAIDVDLRFNNSFDECCKFKTKGMIAAPIKYKGETIGVFQAINKPGGFLQRDVDALSEFSMIMGLALNNALAVEELKRCNNGKTV